MSTRIMFGVVSAIVASTASMLWTVADDRIRLWGVAIGLASIVVVLCGFALWEVHKLRRQVAVDARIWAASAMVEALRIDVEALKSGRTRARAQMSRAYSHGAPCQTAAADLAEVLSQQFQLYLRGRGSRANEP
jgi:hypothetical protein